MLRPFRLFLAVLAIVTAPLAMRSGVAMAAMPTDFREMARTGHCDDEAPDQGSNSLDMAQCCVAMCQAVTPASTLLTERIAYNAPPLFGPGADEHQPFLPELPTPPPRSVVLGMS